MSTPDPNLPTTRQELERKSLDMLEALVHATEQDHVEPGYARVEAHVIWKLTAGLVDQEVSNLAEQVATQADQAAQQLTSKPERIYLFDPTTGKVARISYPFSQPGFAVEFFSGGAATPPITGTTPPGPERRAQLKKFVQALVAKGYRPI